MTQLVEGLPELPAEKEQVIAYLSVEYGIEISATKDMVEKWYDKIPPGYVNDPSGVRPMNNREIGDRILDLDSEDAYKKMQEEPI